MENPMFCKISKNNSQVLENLSYRGGFDIWQEKISDRLKIEKNKPIFNQNKWYNNLLEHNLKLVKDDVVEIIIYKTMACESQEDLDFYGKTKQVFVSYSFVNKSELKPITEKKFEVPEFY